MATIYPKLGHEQEAAKLLLELADSPRDVATSTQSGFCFIVPDELADRYNDYLASTRLPAPPEKKRPGRPRKAAPVKTDGGDE